MWYFSTKEYRIKLFFRKGCENMTKKDIGKILKQLRAKTGKTQAEVAKLIGRKQQVIGHWETGYSQPDANTLFQLCEIYGVSVDEAFHFDKKNQLTQHEIKLIQAYREKIEMQQAVDILLQISLSSQEIEASKEIAEEEKTSYLLEQEETETVNKKNQLSHQRPPA